jgi:hypothetical protein
MQKNIIPYWLLPNVVQQAKVILNTYQKITGIALFDSVYSDEYRSYLLYHAPFVIVSHGTEKDPVFNYANLISQQLWQIDWESFTQMPSRLSAEPERAEDRQRLLDEAAKNGYINNYTGVRISSAGVRFKIENVLLCNLIDEDKRNIGQAAIFRSWTYLS